MSSTFNHACINSSPFLKQSVLQYTTFSYWYFY
uniref:Uncharacterized protein n=1 Tax=Anguilla anguilla TaxID=7936 RepID=A0A0E9TQ34_ANGAN